MKEKPVLLKEREPQLAAVAFQSHDHTSTALKNRQLQQVAG